MKKNLLPAAMAAVFLLVAMPTASAVVYYWDGNGTSAGAGTAPTGIWGTDAFWSVSSAGTASTFNNSTTALDQLRFSAGTDAAGTYTVTVNGTQTARQLALDYGTITFSGGTINLSSNGTIGGASHVATGIVLASTAGNATISSNLTINGAQMLNIAAGRTLTLNTGTFTRNAGASLNVLSTGTVASSMTGLNSLTNDILGPWATFGTNASTRYATITGGGTPGLQLFPLAAEQSFPGRARSRIHRFHVLEAPTVKATRVRVEALPRGSRIGSLRAVAPPRQSQQRLSHPVSARVLGLQSHLASCDAGRDATITITNHLCLARREGIVIHNTNQFSLNHEPFSL